MATPHFYDIDFPQEVYDKNSLKLHPELQDFIEFAQIFCQDFGVHIREKREPIPATSVPAAADLALEYLVMSQARNQPQVIVVNNNAGILEHPTASRAKNVEKEEKERKEKENQTWTALLLGSIGIGLYSLWKVTDSSGQVEYLTNLFELVEAVKVKLNCLDHWIGDRKRLNLLVPETIKKDYLKFQSICDNLEKLNNKQEKIMIRNSYGILTLGAGMIFASRFSPNTTQLLNVGFAGIGMGLCSWIYSKAAYSSNFHRQSLKMIATRTVSDIDDLLMRSEKRQQDLMRLQAPKIPNNQSIHV